MSPPTAPGAGGKRVIAWSTLALLIVATLVVASQAPRLLQAPPFERAPVPPSGQGPGGDNTTLVEMSFAAGSGMLVSFGNVARVEEGSFLLDRPNATLSFAANASLPASWGNAIHVTGEAGPPFLALTLDERPVIEVSWAALNGSRQAMDIWLSFGASLVSLEVPPTQDTRSFGNCSTSWRYEDLPAYENRTQPSGQKEGVEVLLRFPPGSSLDVEFFGDAGSCPNLRTQLSHLGFWGRS